jgi:hypothetical protein
VVTAIVMLPLTHQQDFKKFDIKWDCVTLIVLN